MNVRVGKNDDFENFSVYFVRAATLMSKRELSSSTRTNPPGSTSSSFVEPEYSNFTIQEKEE